MVDPRKARAMKAKTVIEDSGLTRAQIARDSGLSEATVWAWLKETRNPSPDSMRQLAAGLRKRGARLERLADELDRAAGK
jgi:transcriptional regulator with XRE-family HTH domain